MQPKKLYTVPLTDSCFFTIVQSVEGGLDGLFETIRYENPYSRNSTLKNIYQILFMIYQQHNCHTIPLPMATTHQPSTNASIQQNLSTHLSQTETETETGTQSIRPIHSLVLETLTPYTFMKKTNLRRKLDMV